MYDGSVSRAWPLGPVVRGFAMGEGLEQLVDVVVVFEGMPKVMVRVDDVSVPTPFANAGDVPVGLEVGDDLHRGAFGDADEIGNVPDPEIRGSGDGQQHVGVVGEERPGTSFRLRCHARMLLAPTREGNLQT